MFVACDDVGVGCWWSQLMRGQDVVGFHDVGVFVLM